jgi:sugar phosphate isomerase/epimerase
MKLGFVTASLPNWNLEQLAKWASANGYGALEVAAWPDLGDRPFTATHFDPSNFDPDGIRRVLDENDIEISSLAFMDNPLHPDVREREAMYAHLHALIDAAPRIGVPTVGTFVGRNPHKSVKENLRDAEEVFKPIVEHANRNGVKIIIENCVMEGWHPDGYPGNLAYSPELWEWMFSIGLYLNFDPSHLLWIGIDPVTAMKPYLDRIPHAQAKDIQLFPEKRNRYGQYGKAVAEHDPWDIGWWRYRVPGLGEVDWVRLVDAMYEGGFTGVLSVEHEDPVWGGTEDKVLTGLQVAQRHLSPLLVE